MPTEAAAERVPRRRLVLVLMALATSACEQSEIPDHQRIVGGIVSDGQALIVAYGCFACHDIPGIRQPSAPVGPSLHTFGRRAYIAGHLPNRPAMLTAWLRDPSAIDPGTAMPPQGVSQAEARHMAAYLYTLR